MNKTRVFEKQLSSHLLTFRLKKTGWLVVRQKANLLKKLAPRRNVPRDYRKEHYVDAL